MTREQAKREIDFLDYYLQNHANDYSEESHTAMRMAYKALEEESIIDEIIAEINTPNRGSCDYYIVDRIEDIINKYRAESEE